MKNLLSEKHRYNFDMYLDKMEELGYRNYYQVLNAKDYGVPQNRERVFTVSIRKDIQEEYKMPEPKPLELRLKDILEDQADEKYFISQNMMDYFIRNDKAQRKKGNGYHFEPTYGESVAKSVVVHEGAQMQNNFIKVKQIGNLLSNKEKLEKYYLSEKGVKYVLDPKRVVTEKLRIRRLTPKECWRLMGFDDEAFEKAREVNSDTQLYKQAGNSIVVDVLEAILTNLLINPHKLEKEQLSMFDFIER